MCSDRLKNALDFLEQIEEGDDAANELLHVYPNDDEFVHEYSLDCACHPIQDEGIVIHARVKPMTRH